MKDSAIKLEFAILLVGLFVLTCFLKVGWFQNVAFYLFWTYVGLFYREIKIVAEEKTIRRYFLYSALAGMIILCLLHFVGGQSLNMQANKFPPNMIFFAFSIMMMSMILFFLPYLDRFIGWLESGYMFGKIMKLFSTRSYGLHLDASDGRKI